MSARKESISPRWMQDHDESWSRSDEGVNTLVEQGALEGAEELCIDRLLRESEKRGLEQRKGWAKRQCGTNGNDRTSRLLQQEEEAPSAGLGIEAVRAPLEPQEGEQKFSIQPQVGSQCNNPVETHWKPSSPGG